MALLSVVFFSATSHSNPNDYELAPRNGMPSRLLLKGCQQLTQTAVDFAGNDDPFPVEWWRCGSKSPNWKKGYFPLYYVVVRPPTDRMDYVGITITNSGNSDLYFIDELQAVKGGPGSRQLLLIYGRYYQRGAGKTVCMLGLSDEGFDCQDSIGTQQLAGQRLPRHEKSLFRKLDDFFTGP